MHKLLENGWAIGAAVDAEVVKRFFDEPARNLSLELPVKDENCELNPEEEGIAERCCDPKKYFSIFFWVLHDNNFWLN